MSSPERPRTPPLSPENMFGGSPAIASPPDPQNQTEREELKQITGKVVSLSRTVNGLVELRLDNEQVWRQQEADTTPDDRNWRFSNDKSRQPWYISPHRQEGPFFALQARALIG